MITLEVEGMTCQGCVQSVERALKKADPTAEVAVDLASGRVELKGALTPDAAKAAIEATGFDVKN
ncbi:heavy-metal-associated domain-containing protein [Pinisolibacter aquiterrae]|uniref:heavy-metal-associated domain-containing protein n=1 Tax=Pinisolibacter aquiterrae TaxID=2815579 RepID=UPI001E4A5998|nr:cation transporter [Pinisolibacter aquiterrae]MCC8233656.1 cation transporter [Pinisolibacter aquiterrae]